MKCDTCFACKNATHSHTYTYTQTHTFRSYLLYLYCVMFMRFAGIVVIARRRIQLLLPYSAKFLAFPFITLFLILHIDTNDWRRRRKRFKCVASNWRWISVPKRLMNIMHDLLFSLSPLIYYIFKSNHHLVPYRRVHILHSLLNKIAWNEKLVWTDQMRDSKNERERAR